MELHVTPAPVRRAMLASRSHRVLVVDDDADAAEELAAALHDRGHTVATAYTGQAAVAVAAVFRPRLILVDLFMPLVSGREVVACLRGIAEIGTPTIVAVSGAAPHVARERAAAAGFDGCLERPFRPAAVERLISDAAA